MVGGSDPYEPVICALVPSAYLLGRGRLLQLDVSLTWVLVISPFLPRALFFFIFLFWVQIPPALWTGFLHGLRVTFHDLDWGVKIEGRNPLFPVRLENEVGDNCMISISISPSVLRTPAPTKFGEKQNLRIAVKFSLVPLLSWYPEVGKWFRCYGFFSFLIISFVKTL